MDDGGSLEYMILVRGCFCLIGVPLVERAKKAHSHAKKQKFGESTDIVLFF